MPALFPWNGFPALRATVPHSRWSVRLPCNNCGISPIPPPSAQSDPGYVPSHPDPLLPLPAMLQAVPEYYCIPFRSASFPGYSIPVLLLLLSGFSDSQIFLRFSSVSVLTLPVFPQAFPALSVNALPAGFSCLWLHFPASEILHNSEYPAPPSVSLFLMQWSAGCIFPHNLSEIPDPSDTPGFHPPFSWLLPVISLIHARYRQLLPWFFSHYKIILSHTLHRMFLTANPYPALLLQ